MVVRGGRNQLSLAACSRIRDEAAPIGGVLSLRYRSASQL